MCQWLQYSAEKIAIIAEKVYIIAIIAAVGVLHFAFRRKAMPHGQEFDPRQYMLDNAFEAFYYINDDLQRVNSHYHNYYEMYLFESGDVTYVAGENHYDLLPGDILLIPPQEPHYPIFNDRTKTYSRLVLWFSDLFIQNIREICHYNFAHSFDAINERGSHLLRLAPAPRNELFDIVRGMAAREAGPYARAENHIALLSLLICLSEQYSRYARKANSQEAFAKHLVRAVDFIVNHYDRPITLEDVAGCCYLSKYHLAREFKRVMGLTVNQYIRLRRLHRARQLLRGGARPGAAAKASGFSDYSSFYRAYTAEFGLAPKLSVVSEADFDATGKS